MKKIKVLIVDDSILFRSQINLALQDNASIEVIGAVSNGKNALEKLEKEEVDLVTLDLEMPVLDGMGTIKAIQEKKYRCKVIVFSSMSQSGAEKTLEAMSLGAVDFVAKPVADGASLTPAQKIKEALLPRIESLFFLNNTISHKMQKAEIKPSQQNWGLFKPDVLVIASSTGGPNALTDLFQHLQEPLPFPILIAQHMPPVFTASLAQRLHSVCQKKAAEAVHDELLRDNQIYVAPGNFHLSLRGLKGATKVCLDQGEQRNFVRPAADFLFESAAKIFGKHVLAIVLTGMGRDGCDGSQAIKRAGGLVMIQNLESCVVGGMPGAVLETGSYDFKGTPQELAKKVLELSSLKRGTYVA